MWADIIVKSLNNNPEKGRTRLAAEVDDPDENIMALKYGTLLKLRFFARMLNFINSIMVLVNIFTTKV